MSDLEVCNAYLIIDKVSKMLIRTSEKINARLQEIFPMLKTGEYSAEFPGKKEDIKNEYCCTKEINGQNPESKGGCTPTIFYGLRLKKEVTQKNPVLIVCLNQDVINIEETNIETIRAEGIDKYGRKAYIDNDGEDWYYFGLDENILASINYEEDFINEVVNIVSTYYKRN